MILFLMLVSVPVFAVNDNPDFPCDGVYDLDYLFVEVYWKEGATWYKVPNSEMDAIYPWICLVDNSCGGILPWGDPYTCYINGHANNKVTVSASSVPCRTENSNARSCWVWKDQNLNKQYDIYRIDIDSHYLWSEAWYNYKGDEGYELWPYEWSDLRWYSVYNFATGNTTYTSESRTDIRNGDVNWVTTDPNWSVTLRHKKVEKRHRMWTPNGYVYYWESTAGTSDFRDFQISLTKGTGANQSATIEKTEPLEEANGENDFIKDIDLRLAQKISVYSFEGVFKKIFESSSDKNEEDYSTSLRLDRFSDGDIAGLTVEKIDEKQIDEYNVVLNGMTIIAINGYKLEEFGEVEKMLEYLLTAKIYELTVLDGGMNLYNLVSE